ncbi:helix-turn-helix domain-containing protein [Brevibacterium sp. p3-SID960]|uniref:helix-turn-helix domain-containing protein n=1 Tax=Brevibacterium sp. p3-SID960 TaxID=2916063 RepID=UPI0021A95164|nr:helix-turn-helix transcriptional regulator [Brevibacterium sp. p3-SID960]MCT1691412.1 helix-turn-helix domain-containing protein [Brevibacterium sp. p3-SID960]
MDRWSRIIAPEDLGETIQAARMDRGWSQRDLARISGIAQSAISDMESGKHTLYAERLFALLEECGVTLRAEWTTGDAPGS